MKWNKVTRVWKWEVTKHIKSPIFLIFTFLIPAFMLLSSVLPGFVMDRMSREHKDLWLLDETGQFAPLLQGVVNTRENLTLKVSTETYAQMKDKVEKGEIESFIYVTSENLESGNIQIILKNAMDLPDDLRSILQPAFTTFRLMESGISPDEFSRLVAPVSVRVTTVSGEAPGVASILVPMLTGVLLFLSILFSGQILMQSVIKEKRNRIIEVLLSTISSTELLFGKIIAFGTLGLIQIGIWVSAGTIAASRFMDISELGIKPAQLLTTLPFFILGYLMLATIFAAMAATMKDAESGSQAHGLVIMIPVLPLMMAAAIMMAPNGPVARVMSFIPVFTPATMLLRLGVTTVPTWEIVATSLLLLITTGFFLRIGARIYEGSLLKFDSAASLKDVIRLARNKN